MSWGLLTPQVLRDLATQFPARQADIDAQPFMADEDDAPYLAPDAFDAEDDGMARIAVVLPPTQRVLAFAHDVPGFGWRRWDPEALSVPEVTVTEGADATGTAVPARSSARS